MSNQCYCGNTSCRCHKDPKFKIDKPFLTKFGRSSCCNECARHVYQTGLDRLDNLP